MTSLLQDLRFALRHMRRSPGFAITAILILGLGIAANVIVFGVLDALMLRPINVPHPDRVMTLTHIDQPYPDFSYPEVRDLRDNSSVFSAVAAFVPDNLALEADHIARPVWAYQVTGQYFEVVAIKPYLGRLLQRADDDHPGASAAAVLSWPAWKGYFGSDPNIVGKIVRLDKQPYTIVGVTPEGFYGTEKMMQPDIFVPMANEVSMDGWNWLEARQVPHVWSVVRLKDGVTMPKVQAELNTIAARIAHAYPKDEEKLSFKLTRVGMMGDYLAAPARAFLAGVLGLAGIVLLAACTNLGSLFAARTADRAREIAIRMAIGASRWRVVRQILVEAFAISIIGGVFACGLAWITFTFLANWHLPTEYPAHFHIVPDPSLIFTALLFSLLAGGLFGVVPLRQIFKADPNGTIKSGSSQSPSARRWAFRDVLLAAQVALCCVTVTAGFVSLRGLGKTMKMDLGFNPRDAVLARFDLSQSGYSGETADRIERQLQERVARLPGVEASSYADTTPLKQDAPLADIFSYQATDFRSSNRQFDAWSFSAAPGYFAAAGTRLVSGRDVSYTDTPKTPAVAVVNREFARRLFHSENVIGRYYKDQSGQAILIVGVVEDGKYLFLSEDSTPAVFHPISQKASGRSALIARMQPGSSVGAVRDLAATIRKVVRDVDPSISLRECSLWSSQLGIVFLPAQVATVALGLFGAFGLMLSIIGTFGLASYTVGKRLRELSIRVALGAQARQIISAALGRMLILLAVGSVAGILLGVAASRVLSAIVYQATAQDPAVLGAVALTVLITGSLSVVGPVRRALRVDPANLFRQD